MEEKKTRAFLVKTVLITCKVDIYHNNSTLELTALIGHLKGTFYNKNSDKFDQYFQSESQHFHLKIPTALLFQSNGLVWGKKLPAWWSMKTIWLTEPPIISLEMFKPPQIFLFKQCRKLQNIQLGEEKE